jgi:uncharacterized secreted protein with C-terminal beta-propeller domain
VVSSLKSRKWLLAAVLVALAAGFATPFLVASLAPLPAERAGGPSPSRGPVAQPVHAAELKGLRTFSSLEELRDYVARLRALQQSAGSLGAYAPAVVAPLSAPIPAPAPAPVAVAEETSTRYAYTAPTEYSTTNIQVEGVDEPDVAKTNGRVIAVCSGDSVYVIDPSARRVVSRVRTPTPPTSLYLTEDRLVVLSSLPQYRVMAAMPRPSSPVTAVYVYDLGKPESPRLLYNATVSGWLTASRFKEGYLYLVATLPISEADVPLVDGQPITPSHVAAVAPEPTPHISTYTVLLALELGTGSREAYAFLMGSTSWFYMSRERLYVGHSAQPSVLDVYEQALRAAQGLVPDEVYRTISSALDRGDVQGALGALLDYASRLGGEGARRLVEQLAGRVGVVEPATTFHVFEVKGLALEYRGGFSVPGVVLDQFSMEEYSGYFLVAVTRFKLAVRGAVAEAPGLVPPPGSSVKVVECAGGRCVERELRLNETTRIVAPGLHIGFWPQPLESDNCLFAVRLSDLRLAGNVTGLAPGERVYSSRLVGSTFYLVTFRDVDPLFAVDVSNPERPSVLGYIKAPGFSEYLHPLPGGRLLGVGVNPERESLKISLFDVSNPREMREVSTVEVEGATSQALWDHHAVTVWLSRRLVLLPISLPAGSGVAAVEFTESALKLRALLEHPGASRALYVGSEIFTVSTGSVRVYSAETLQLLGEVKLEQ